MALSSPNIPTLLRMSVVAQATRKMPNDAAPRRRAMRKVKTPRKFEASRAMVLKNIPRFNSDPVRSGLTRSSAGGNSVAVAVEIGLTRRQRPGHADESKQCGRLAFRESN